MKKKIKDLVPGDKFTYFNRPTLYKVVQLFPETKQLLAYVPVDNRYCTFSTALTYSNDEVTLITEVDTALRGKDLCAGDRFLWSDRIDSHLKTVVYATDEWIVFKLTQENGHIHYGVIYKDSRVWEEKIILCE